MKKFINERFEYNNTGNYMQTILFIGADTEKLLE